MSLNIKIEKMDNKTILILSGEVKFQDIQKLHKKMIDSLDCQEIDLNCINLVKFNFAFIQLFFSFIKTAKARNIILKVLHTKDDQFCSIMTDYGAEWIELEPYCTCSQKVAQ